MPKKIIKKPAKSKKIAQKKATKIQKKSATSIKPAQKKTITKSATTRPLPVPKELRVEPYWQELNKVIDPEINLGVVDLGLIYDIQLKNGKCTITMSLTTPACPYGPTLLKNIEDRMRLYKDVKSVKINIVWDPVWNQDFIDQDIRDLMLGF